MRRIMNENELGGGTDSYQVLVVDETCELSVQYSCVVVFCVVCLPLYF